MQILNDRIIKFGLVQTIMDEGPTMNPYSSDPAEPKTRLETTFEEMISFSEVYKSYCVGIVDIVNSTRITARLNESKIRKYYGIFLNTMALIVKEYDGIVIKNIGDSLLFYFPKTSDSSDKPAFEKSLECGLKMIDMHNILNDRMSREQLPNLDYRISSDHGMITIAKSVNSFSEDIFGQTVNICAKINNPAKSNSMVIGGDLYQLVKSFEKYRFDSIFEYNNGLKLHYPVYSVERYKS